ncbi:MAG: hypothetical protein ACKVQR_23770, partial [Aquabacterium sp.]
PPRQALRSRIHWSAGGDDAKKGITYSPAFGIGASTEAVPRADGQGGRLFLDCGENPPNGAILYYWLPAGFKGTVRLSVADAQGVELMAWSSDDKDAPPARKPGTRAGLNRFVWNLKSRGPAKLDLSLLTRACKPFAEESSDISGPLVPPGRYSVVLEAGGKRQDAVLVLQKDPRVKTPQKAFDQQAALLKRLYANLGQLNSAVNRLRQVKRQLRDVAARLPGDASRPLREQATGLVTRLEAVEAVLVDIHRVSPRDILRNPAGLNDTLVDMISVVAIADEAPTTQARQVSDEVMARVDAEVAKFDALVAGDVAVVNAALAAAGVGVLGSAAA